MREFWVPRSLAEVIERCVDKAKVLNGSDSRTDAVEAIFAEFERRHPDPEKELEVERQAVASACAGEFEQRLRHEWPNAVARVEEFEGTMEAQSAAHPAFTGHVEEHRFAHAAGCAVAIAWQWSLSGLRWQLPQGS